MEDEPEEEEGGLEDEPEPLSGPACAGEGDDDSDLNDAQEVFQTELEDLAEELDDMGELVLKLTYFQCT